jgi:Protein of unknown function (DUF551)
MSDKIDATSLAWDNPIRHALHDARINRLCEGLHSTRIDWKDLEIEQLKQALHDARIENSGQAAELERIREARRWIPVEERLPELGVDVLVLHSGKREVAWRHVVDGDWMSNAALGEITHWMPLPEPPEALP